MLLKKFSFGRFWKSILIVKIWFLLLVFVEFLKHANSRPVDYPESQNSIATLLWKLEERSPSTVPTPTTSIQIGLPENDEDKSAMTDVNPKQSISFYAIDSDTLNRLFAQYMLNVQQQPQRQTNEKENITSPNNSEWEKSVFSNKPHPFSSIPDGKTAAILLNGANSRLAINGNLIQYIYQVNNFRCKENSINDNDNNDETTAKEHSKKITINNVVTTNKKMSKKPDYLSSTLPTNTTISITFTKLLPKKTRPTTTISNKPHRFTEKVSNEISNATTQHQLIQATPSSVSIFDFNQSSSGSSTKKKEKKILRNTTSVASWWYPTTANKPRLPNRRHPSTKAQPNAAIRSPSLSFMGMTKINDNKTLNESIQYNVITITTPVINASSIRSSISSGSTIDLKPTSQWASNANISSVTAWKVTTLPSSFTLISNSHETNSTTALSASSHQIPSSSSSSSSSSSFSSSSFSTSFSFTKRNSPKTITKLLPILTSTAASWSSLSVLSTSKPAIFTDHDDSSTTKQATTKFFNFPDAESNNIIVNDKIESHRNITKFVPSSIDSHKFSTSTLTDLNEIPQTDVITISYTPSNRIIFSSTSKNGQNHLNHIESNSIKNTAIKMTRYPSPMVTWNLKQTNAKPSTTVRVSSPTKDGFRVLVKKPISTKTTTTSSTATTGIRRVTTSSRFVLPNVSPIIAWSSTRRLPFALPNVEELIQIKKRFMQNKKNFFNLILSTTTTTTTTTRRPPVHLFPSFTKWIRSNFGQQSKWSH